MKPANGSFSGQSISPVTRSWQSAALFKSCSKQMPRWSQFQFRRLGWQAKITGIWRRSKRRSILPWRFLPSHSAVFSQVRFNAVAPGLLKTSASAGIPGYVDSYLYAERIIPRHKAVQTDEVANAVAFLLSPRSSGINAQQIIIDAGMSINYFDREIVARGNA